VDGPLLTIRKFRSEPFTLDSMAAAGAMTNDAAALLKIAVKSRCNILLTGGAGSGKTTLLNALAGCASASDRIVVCEDAAELRLDHRHTVRLETRTPNFEGKGGVCMAALIKNTLRMRPDRIIVGEVRGAEAFDLLQALNTGHDGSMGTLHANNPAQALPRLEAMAMMGAPGVSESAIRRLVYGGLDVIVHLTRTAAGRRVQSIASVTDGGVTPLLSEHGRITVTERLTQRADEQGLGSSLAELAG
jgi:pilus assembly protein CpaF